MLYKQPGSKYYWTKFNWQGETYRKATGARDKVTARTIESKIRSELAQGNFGILQPKQTPTLAEFLKKDFKPFTKSRFKQVPKTLDYYFYGIESLLTSDLAKLQLTEITNQQSTLPADKLTRQDDKTKLSASTVNCVLRTFRRALKLAKEWGKIDRAPKITLAKGERQRERVLTEEEMSKYLLACGQP